MKEKCCAVIASSPMSFPWGYDEEDEGCAALRLLLLNRLSLLRAQGISRFAVVLDAGFGLYASEMLAALKESDPEISLTCFVPWEGQATKWTPELRERYFHVQSESAEVYFASAVETVDCRVIALLNAVDMADTVIAVYSNQDIPMAAALRYGERLRREIIRLKDGTGRNPV